LVYAWFLASWAKVLSWQGGGPAISDELGHGVSLGRGGRHLGSGPALPRWHPLHRVDELAWKKGHKYLTLVYQLDHGCKRLLWIGQDRTMKTFHGFFDFLGESRAQSIAFIVSDMWRAFLTVVAKRASAAVHVLDRFHVEQLLHKAIDTVRRQEVRALRSKGAHAVLTKTRWILLKRRDNLTRPQAGRLRELVRINLKSVRAYLLKEQFRRFWSYTSLLGPAGSSTIGPAWPCAPASLLSRPSPRPSATIATSYSTGSALAKPSPNHGRVNRLQVQCDPGQFLVLGNCMIDVPSAADVTDVTMFRSGFPPTLEHPDGDHSTWGCSWHNPTGNTSQTIATAVCLPAD
jgi:Transposase